MKTIKVQNDLASEIKKEKQKLKIELLTQENDLLVKNLNKPGWSFKASGKDLNTLGRLSILYFSNINFLLKKNPSIELGQSFSKNNSYIIIISKEIKLEITFENSQELIELLSNLIIFYLNLA